METGGIPEPRDAIGNNGGLYGPYQITYNYWFDASKEDPSLTYDGRSWENTKGPGSYHYSEKVMQAYMNRYATYNRLGHYATDEDIARIHNGGPNGYKMPATLHYWKKVEKQLSMYATQSLWGWD